MYIISVMLTYSIDSAKRYATYVELSNLRLHHVRRFNRRMFLKFRRKGPPSARGTRNRAESLTFPFFFFFKISVLVFILPLKHHGRHGFGNGLDRRLRPDERHGRESGEIVRARRGVESGCLRGTVRAAQDEAASVQGASAAGCAGHQ